MENNTNNTNNISTIAWVNDSTMQLEGYAIPNFNVNPILKLTGEEQLAHRVALFMSYHYPDLYYRFDVAADLKISSQDEHEYKKDNNPHKYNERKKRNKRKAQKIFGTIKAKYRHKKKYPDLFIARVNKLYAGMYVELKIDKSKIWNGAGNYASDHVRQQAQVLSHLNNEGYFATFGIATNNQVFKLIMQYMRIGR